MGLEKFLGAFKSTPQILEGIKNSIFKKENIEAEAALRWATCKECPSLDKEGNKLEPFGSQDFPTNTFTWLSPGLNQTHRLKNISSDTTCVSLNCYLYGESNSVHYDYFDYVDSDGTIQHYEPEYQAGYF